jgi:predicted dehydrogenase
MTPIRMGLVGAGPWAEMVHAPILAAGPETELTAIWARRQEAAAGLAALHGAQPCASFEELLERCDAVAFAVPPAVQAVLALQAAAAGKALLLEKPIADSLPAAVRLADAVGAAGVASLVLLTARFSAPVRSFLAEAEAFDAFGAVHENISGGFLEGPFSQSPWRHERGALLDLGPHVLDLLTCALGPVEDIGASATRGFVRLSLRHRSGALSTSTLSAVVPGATAGQRLRLFGPGGVLEADLSVDMGVFATVRAEFAASVRSGEPHACDVHRGLELQALLHRAEQALAP